MVDEFGATSARIGAHAVVQHFGDGGQRPLEEREQCARFPEWFLEGKDTAEVQQ
jgi:hypothetical protein